MNLGRESQNVDKHIKTPTGKSMTFPQVQMASLLNASKSHGRQNTNPIKAQAYASAASTQSERHGASPKVPIPPGLSRRVNREMWVLYFTCPPACPGTHIHTDTLER